MPNLAFHNGEATRPTVYIMGNANAHAAKYQPHRVHVRWMNELADYLQRGKAIHNPDPVPGESLSVHEAVLASPLLLHPCNRPSWEVCAVTHDMVRIPQCRVPRTDRKHVRQPLPHQSDGALLKAADAEHGH